MVCYHILTGKVPFDGDRSRALRAKIQKQNLRPEFNNDDTDDSPSMTCPIALVNMVRCCWHRNSSASPNFNHIANFLRQMKICAVQIDALDYSHTLRQQQLLGMPLFTIFQSKELWEMGVASRRILQLLERGSLRNPGLIAWVIVNQRNQWNQLSATTTAFPFHFRVLSESFKPQA